MLFDFLVNFVLQFTPKFTFCFAVPFIFRVFYALCNCGCQKLSLNPPNLLPIISLKLYLCITVDVMSRDAAATNPLKLVARRANLPLRPEDLMGGSSARIHRQNIRNFFSHCKNHAVFTNFEQILLRLLHIYLAFHIGRTRFNSSDRSNSLLIKSPAFTTSQCFVDRLLSPNSCAKP